MKKADVDHSKNDELFKIPADTQVDSRLDDWFIEHYLKNEGETLSEARERLYSKKGGNQNRE